MSGYDYNTLSEAIKKYSENYGDDFAAAIPSIIENSVRSIGREIDPPGFRATTTVNSSLLNPEVTLPDECLVIHSVAKVSGNNKKLLKRRPYDFIVTYWPNITSVASPIYYDRTGESVIYLAPTPEENTPIEIRYSTVSIPTPTNPESFVLSKYPDLVLQRCMVEANLVMKSMEDAATWGSAYKGTKEAVINEARRNRRDDTQTPTISSSYSNNVIPGSQ